MQKSERFTHAWQNIKHKIWCHMRSLNIAGPSWWNLKWLSLFYLRVKTPFGSSFKHIPAKWEIATGLFWKAMRSLDIALKVYWYISVQCILIHNTQARENSLLCNWNSWPEALLSSELPLLENFLKPPSKNMSEQKLSFARGWICEIASFNFLL